MCGAIGPAQWLRRRASGAPGTSSARVRESPLANSVTSCPRSSSASVRKWTTRSVPPYSFGGTRSYNGEICAILNPGAPGSSHAKVITESRLGAAVVLARPRAHGLVAAQRIAKLTLQHRREQQRGGRRAALGG